MLIYMYMCVFDMFETSIYFISQVSAPPCLQVSQALCDLLRSVRV